MEKSKKIVLNSYEYKQFKSKRIKLIRLPDIVSHKDIKKGSSLRYATVCSLCGSLITEHDFITDKNIAIKDIIYLSTGSIVSFYLCKDPKTCYLNKIRKEKK